MAGVPLPGHPVRGSTTGRPLYVLFELIARRWTLRIVWELRDGPLSFVDLRARCDNMSTSTLAIRLRDLMHAELITQNDAGAYALTRLGANLPEQLGPLIAWADDWADALSESQPAGSIDLP
ncbi:MAG: helix-turn-helix domain-containing protein [Rhodoglobus sp.]